MPQDRISSGKTTAYFHLPGLFEFYELYKRFLPLFFEHREYFYEWCGIGSIYGAPAGCIWGGGLSLIHIYSVMQHQRDFGEKYIRILRDCFVSMDMAQNILVIKTVSGMAMAVAEALDVIGFHEICLLYTSRCV